MDLNNSPLQFAPKDYEDDNVVSVVLLTCPKEGQNERKFGWIVVDFTDSFTTETRANQELFRNSEIGKAMTSLISNANNRLDNDLQGKTCFDGPITVVNGTTNYRTYKQLLYRAHQSWGWNFRTDTFDNAMYFGRVREGQEYFIVY